MLEKILMYVVLLTLAAISIDAKTKRYEGRFALHPEFADSELCLAACSLRAYEYDDEIKISATLSSFTNNADMVELSYKVVTAGGTVIDPGYRVPHKPGQTSRFVCSLKNSGTNSVDSIIVDISWSRNGADPRRAVQLFVESLDSAYDPSLPEWTILDNAYVEYTEYSRPPGSQEELKFLYDSAPNSDSRKMYKLAPAWDGTKRGSNPAVKDVGPAVDAEPPAQKP